MNNQSRRQLARATRNNATDLAASRPHPRHFSNGEECRYRRGGNNKECSYIANFTKGLPHDTKTGLLLNPPDYRQFVLGGCPRIETVARESPFVSDFLII